MQQIISISFYKIPGSLAGKESACNAGDTSLIWVTKIHCRSARLPIPIVLPGEFHGREAWQATHSPRGHTQLDTTERLTHTHSSIPGLPWQFRQ